MQIYLAMYDSAAFADDSRGAAFDIQHTQAHRLAACALERDFGLSDVVCEYGKNNKPFIGGHPDKHFNLSHTKGMVACVTGNRPVGIDIESIREFSPSVLRKLSEEEQSYIRSANHQAEAMMRFWTLKEAYLKMRGTGLAEFFKVQCVPGQKLPDAHYRQFIWQNHYIVTAVESLSYEGENKMDFQFAGRLDSFEEGIFSVLNDKKNELLKAGKKVYNMSVGTPDFKPAQHIMDAVCEAASKPENYKYALTDMPALLDAVSKRYEQRYGVKGLQHQEIMSIYGSQEGMAHIAMALCDPGDIVLVPNPGYPVFTAGPYLCGARVETYELHKENGYLIEFDKIPEELAKQAKCMIVSYPLNPVCVTAPDTFYDELIAFAKKYQIIILHDNAYSDIIYGGRTGKSFLAFEGAKEVGVEFYSLSKSYNYTGARMSFVVGNAAIIERFKCVRSQIDYGIFLPVQYGAIAALTGPQDAVIAQCEEYDRRNHALSEGLTAIGWPVPLSQGTMFAWAPIPEGFASSDAFVMELMEKTGLICTPGSSFGSLGEGYVRFALVLDVPTIQEAVQAVKESGILQRGENHV